MSWLQDQNKCNQFVGEALYRAGVKIPMNTMKDGSVHVMEAEKWPSQKHLFSQIKDSSEIKKGDLIVYDYPARGASTAHIEVIVDPNTRAGAHGDGAYLQPLDKLDELPRDPKTGAWIDEMGRHVYVLRAQRLRPRG